ncbi:hypothetical protein NEDG_01628 [Nematocida displodere]|uniref:Yip1 domain-containing protein n=1 Tax=Nematocida displodere TaxID=1805483 RepID=A0A177EGW7_9MICR|nr:hypothetical protein NEDG_01628 [Nematocida displodere]
MPVHVRHGGMPNIRNSISGGRMSFSVKRENINILKSLKLYPIGLSKGTEMSIYVPLYLGLVYFFAAFLIKTLSSTLVSSWASSTMLLVVATPTIYMLVFSPILLVVCSYCYSRFFKISKLHAAAVLMYSIVYILPIVTGISVITILTSGVGPSAIEGILGSISGFILVIVSGYIARTNLKDMVDSPPTQREEFIKEMVILATQLVFTYIMIWLINSTWKMVPIAW